MQDSHFRVWCLFLSQVIAIAGLLNWFGKLEPTPQFDTSSYRDYSLESASKALNDKRTFVYPCVLRLFVVADGSERLVPWFQYLSSAFAVGLFLAALLRCDWNPWLALGAASPILASPMVLEYSGTLTPDLLAQSFSILAVSLWLIVVHTGRSLWACIGLSAFVFLAYQTKPSYLFLLAFVPMGGLIARWWLHSEKSDALRVCSLLSTASVLPFLGWCTLRWFIVGHFGLVSFGGYNIIGIAGQLLKPAWISQLNSDVKPLAEEISKRRDQQRNWSTDTSYDHMESRFNAMVWEIAVPAASELYESDSRIMNRQMANLSGQILLGHPESYATWLWMAAKRAIRASIELTLRNPIVMLSMPILLVAFAIGWRNRSANAECVAEVYQREFQVIVWMAIGYAICKLGLVVLVEPPIDRYCAPAAVFLPSVLVMMACRMVLKMKCWLHPSRLARG